MDQWVKETTRYRGEDEPSQLDLLFTKKTEDEPSIDYLCPVGKSDHVLMEINIYEEEIHRCNEDYKKEIRNYAKTNFTGLKVFYKEIEWRKLLEGKGVQEKYKVFLSKYKEGIERYVLKY